MSFWDKVKLTTGPDRNINNLKQPVNNISEMENPNDFKQTEMVTDVPIEQSVSDYDQMINNIGATYGYTPEMIEDSMNRISFHETGPNQRYESGAIQEAPGGGQGPGRGLFQFEVGKGQGANTAINRLIAQNKGAVPSFLEGISQSNYDVSSLTPEQQQAIFLGNLLQMPHKEGKVPSSFAGVDTDEELANYWAQHHQAGTQVGSDAQSQMVNKFLSDIAHYGG